MKKILILAVMALSLGAYAQVDPTFVKDGDKIKATYFHANGEKSQEGYFVNEKHRRDIPHCIGVVVEDRAQRDCKGWSCGEMLACGRVARCALQVVMQVIPCVKVGRFCG